jgi:hypothetical protein
VIDASNKRAIEKLELEQMIHLRKECVAEVNWLSFWKAANSTAAVRRPGQRYAPSAALSILHLSLMVAFVSSGSKNSSSPWFSPCV